MCRRLVLGCHSYSQTFTNLGGCYCLDVHDPVCAVNGMTFLNPCTAICENMDIECKGECPCQTGIHLTLSDIQCQKKRKMKVVSLHPN